MNNGLLAREEKNICTGFRRNCEMPANYMQRSVTVDISFLSTRVSRFSAYTIHLSYITVASRELVFLTNRTRTHLLRYLSKREARFTQNTLKVLSSSHRRQD
jgi:hypothetical protein